MDDFKRYYCRMLIAEERVAELEPKVALLEGKYVHLERLNESQLGYVEWFARKCAEAAKRKKIKPVLGADVAFDLLKLI